MADMDSEPQLSASTHESCTSAELCSSPRKTACLKSASASESNPTQTRDNLWEIHGKFYDLQKFVKYHPGGIQAIESGQGMCCTELFETYHPFTEKHKETLSRFLVADKNGKPPFTPTSEYFEWKETPLYDDIKKVTRNYFAPRGDESSTEIQRNMKATWSILVRDAIGICITAAAFFRWCQGNGLAMIYFPILYWMVCSSLMHNGSHFAMSTKSWFNLTCACFGFFHVSYYLWNVQHVVGHHVHTNVRGIDPDIEHFHHDIPTEANIPGYRSHQDQRYLSKYERFWKFAVFYQAGATTVAIALLNVPKYLTDLHVEVSPIPARYIRKVQIDRLILVGMIACFLYYHGIAWGIFTIFWSWAIHGMCFNIFSQISHVNERSMMKGADEYRQRTGREKIEWAAHQILSCYDYNCDSTFWGIVSINLNNQIAHHVFPGVHPIHYPALRRLMLPIAEKHGLDYALRSANGFLDLLSFYFGWLTKLNEPPQQSSDSYSNNKQRQQQQHQQKSYSTYWALTLGAAFLCLFLVLPLASLPR